MIKDRTEEFRMRAYKNKTITLRELQNKENGISIDMDDTEDVSPSESVEFLNQDHWADVDSFLVKVADVQRRTEMLENLVKQLSDIHGEILMSPGAHSDLILKLNNVVDDFTTLSSETNKLLKSINQAADNSVDDNGAQFRIKKNQVFAMKRRLQNVISEFGAEQGTYKEKCQARMHNYLKCVDNEMTDAEVDAAIESGKLFSTTSIMMGDRDKRLLEDVQSRHEDIVKLEKSIAVLHEMFQDLEMLVEAQGEILNNIETNVSRAAAWTEQAHKNVTQAKAMKEKGLKMKIGICICVTIMIFLLLTLGAGAFCFYLPFICR